MRGVAASLSSPFVRWSATPLTICCVAAWLGCGSPDAGTEKTQNASLPTIEAAVVTVQLQPWPTSVRCQGSLVADEAAVIGTRVAGRVAAVHVELGDAVRAGDPLATLEQDEFRLQVEQAEAQLAQARSAVGLKADDSLDQLAPHDAPPVRQELAVWDEAKANLRRLERLKADKVIAQAEFEQAVAAERVAEARYAAALNSVHEKIALIGVRQAELALARQQLQDAVIAAPFDGLIQDRHVAPGGYVPVGEAIATLVRNQPLHFRGALPERYAQQLQIGQGIRLQIESVAEPRTIRVTRISPEVDPSSRTLRFEAEVDNADGRLRTGLFAQGAVEIDPQAQALIVPHSAVVEFAGTEKVWKVVADKADQQEVRTGQRRPEGIEIVEGLAAGDVVLCDAGQGRVALVRPLPGQPDRDAGPPIEQLTEQEGSPQQAAE